MNELASQGIEEKKVKRDLHLFAKQKKAERQMKAKREVA
jgi:hypothetical protein